MTGNGREMQSFEDDLRERVDDAAYVPPVQSPVATTEKLTQTILTRADAQSDWAMRIADYINKHAAYLDNLCQAYARQQRQDAQDFVREVTAAEGRKMAELKKQMGESELQ